MQALMARATTLSTTTTTMLSTTTMLLATTLLSTTTTLLNCRQRVTNIGEKAVEIDLAKICSIWPTIKNKKTSMSGVFLDIFS